MSFVICFARSVCRSFVSDVFSSFVMVYSGMYVFSCFARYLGRSFFPVCMYCCLYVGICLFRSLVRLLYMCVVLYVFSSCCIP